MVHNFTTVGERGDIASSTVLEGNRRMLFKNRRIFLKIATDFLKPITKIEEFS